MNWAHTIGGVDTIATTRAYRDMRAALVPARDRSRTRHPWHQSPEPLFSLDNCAAGLIRLPWCPEGHIFAGRFTVPMENAEIPSLYMAAPRAGKSILMNLSALSALQLVGCGHAQSLMATDPKGELLYLLSRYLPRSVIHYFEPGNPRESSSWSAYRDYPGVEGARALGALFSPVSPLVENKFFDDSARNILKATSATVRVVYGDDAEVFHLTDELVTPERTARFLKREPVMNASVLASFYGSKAPNRDVVSTIANRFNELADTANAMRHCGTKFTVGQCQRGECVILIGYNHRAPETTQAYLRAVVTCDMRGILAGPDIYRPRHFRGFDEAPYYGKLDMLVPALALGSAKGLSAWVGTQDLALMEEVYGPTLTRALSALCAKFFGRLSDPASAEFASKHFPQQENRRVTRSISHVVGADRPSTTYSASEHIERVPSLPPEFFMHELRPMNPRYGPFGVPFAAASPILGCYVDEIPLAAIRRWLPRREGIEYPELKLPVPKLLAPPIELSSETDEAHVESTPASIAPAGELDDTGLPYE